MKTVIYNIGMLAGILPADVRKLEGEQMGHVGCLHDAYLVIEDGVISEFGEGRGLQDRATPLAAGGGAQACLGGVVLQTSTFTKLRDNPILDDQISIMQALHMTHLLAFQFPHISRQNSRQHTYIIYYRLHYLMNSTDFSMRGCI